MQITTVLMLFKVSVLFDLQRKKPFKVLRTLQTFKKLMF